VIRREWSCASILAAFLVFITISRMLLIVAVAPIAGYANNYDFVRQSSCVGVWQNYPGGKPKTAASPATVVNELTFDGDLKPDVCLPSSDNLFPWFVAHWHRKGWHPGLRMIGCLKAATAALLLAATLLQPMAPRLRLALSLAGFLVFGDIALLSYFNTLYLDGSIVIFGFASVALAAILFCRNTPSHWAFSVLIAMVLAWFVAARQQYAVFGLGLAVLCAGRLWQHRRRDGLAMGVATAAMAAGVLYLSMNVSDHTRNINRANIVDTVLGAVLPAAPDKPTALRILGLPPDCAPAIGLNWYSPGFQTRDPCPAVTHVGRLRLLRLFAAQPATFIVPMRLAIDASRPAYLSYLARFERPADAALPRIRLIEATSLSTFLAWLPPMLYVGMIVVSCLAGAAGAAASIVLRRRPPAAAADAALHASVLIGLGGCLTFFALFSSVFGDGFAEVPRHAVAILIGIAFQVSAAAIPATGLTIRSSRRISLSTAAMATGRGSQKCNDIQRAPSAL
jgi:hypothetical protein